MACNTRALVLLALLLRCAALNRYNWCKQKSYVTDCSSVQFTQDEGIDLRPSDEILLLTFSLIFRANNFKTLTGNGPLSMFSRLSIILIVQNELTSISDDFFNGMPLLRSVHLYHNNLKTIPMAIHSLPRLYYLSINHNNIKGKINEKLFFSFQNHETIEILKHGNAEILLSDNLTKNCIEKFKPKKVTRYTRDLSYNQIDGIEGSPFMKMTSLNELHLSGNRIGTLIGEPFAGLSSLTHLYLNNAEIGDLPINIFNSTKQLQVLHLQGAFKPGTFNLKLDHIKSLSLNEIALEYNVFMCDCSIEWLWQEVTGNLSHFGRNIKGLTSNGGLNCFSVMLGKMINLIDLQDGFCARRVWSSWGPWSECYAVPPCKNNITFKFQRRQRECLRTEKMHFPCLGEASERIPCGTENCEPIPAVNGGWSAWSPWSVCSVSCEQGIKTRQRLCNQPKPQGFGHTCNGENVETKMCYDKPCPYIKVVELNSTQLAYMTSFLQSHEVTEAKMNAVLEEISNDRPLIITLVSTSVLILLLYYGTFLWLWAVKRKKKIGKKYDKTKITDFNSYHEDVRKKEEDKVNRFLKDKSWFGGSDDTSVLPPMPFKSSEMAKNVFTDGFVYNGKFIQNRPEKSSGYPSTSERRRDTSNIHEETTSELELNEKEGMYVEIPERLLKKKFSHHDDNDSISSSSSYNGSSNSFDCSKNDSEIESRVDSDKYR